MTRLTHRLVAVAVLPIAACTAPAPTRPNEDAAVREFAAKGYASVEHHAVTTSHAAWMVADEPVTLVLTQPVRSGALPVVIYLPGLGEASDAGERWRAGWSAAGYAVLAVQLLADDADAWHSPLAREGEFKELGRQHYAAAALRRRVERLTALMAEGQRRTAAGEIPWQALNWQRVALVGYDLGAYTAMAAVGEQVGDGADGPNRLPVQAAIALSPFASITRGSAGDRYRDIRGPVMSVTSDVDADPLGVVEGAYLRDMPFSHMPGPDKFLLSLRGLPHAGLGGNAERQPAKTDGEASKHPAHAGDGNGDEPSGPPRRGGGRRGGGGGGGAGGPPRPSREGNAPGGNEIGQGLTPGARQMRVIAAQDVSTAFLDAYLKDDALAREWLANDASRWLGTMGQLRRK